MSGLKITYIFPSRSRREKFFFALDNIRNLSSYDNYEIIAVLDVDDPTMNNDEVKERLKQYPNVRPYYGLSTGKIHACNRELDKISYDTEIVCLHSDDMVFIRKDYDLSIMEAFADGFNGLAHFPDQVQRKNLCTYAILSAEWVRFFGFIYDPRFTSVYPDRELQDIAKRVGKYKYIDEYILEHRHYRWGYNTKGEKIIGVMAEPDELSKQQDSPEVYEKDKEVYFSIKNLSIVTSLSPYHANYEVQRQTINSWKNIGKVYSLNSAGEIFKLRGSYNDVTFVETRKTLTNLFKKSLVSINAIIDFAIHKETDLMLINSDISLNGMPEFRQDGVTILSRYDYTDNLFDSNKFEAGFDVFYIPNKYLDVFPPSIYSLGAAWFDYWIPFHCIIHNIPMYYPKDKYAFHKIHQTQYSIDEWLFIGHYFKWEFRLPETDIGQVATNALDRIKMNLIPV